ncbi:hypothetical protein NDU88_005942 [Pleurodeles waltl]|uniref:Uncharacterized protein n=1 Tax=Pleurodeles waltl TaxID=8319 RepID=A0AAV7L611_PLEWA|nr:hypothetical protein NDU88_005942 [Pleurodeles waltl]
MGRNWVAELQGKEGKRLTSSPEIVEVFASYYEEIYASRAVHTERDCGELLGDLQLQVLSADDRAALDQDLTVQEVREAIGGLQSGKATGPNFLPVELHKCVANIAAPLMPAMFQEAKIVGHLQPDLREAMIVVIHKKRQATKGM